MWCGLIGLDFYNTCYGLVFIKEETMKRVGFACHRQFHCFNVKKICKQLVLFLKDFSFVLKCASDTDRILYSVF